MDFDVKEKIKEYYGNKVTIKEKEKKWTEILKN